MAVAEANQSQVKVHRILSNTHRQASVSTLVPGSTALGWEAGGQPTPSGQWVWLRLKTCDLGWDRGWLGQSWGACLGSRQPALDMPAPHPVLTSTGQCWCSGPWPAAWPMLTLSCPLQRVVLSFDFPFYGHPLRQITIATGGKAGSVGLGKGLEILRGFTGDRTRDRVVWTGWGGSHAWLSWEPTLRREVRPVWAVPVVPVCKPVNEREQDCTESSVPGPRLPGEVRSLFDPWVLSHREGEVGICAHLERQGDTLWSGTLFLHVIPDPEPISWGWRLSSKACC